MSAVSALCDGIQNYKSDCAWTHVQSMDANTITQTSFDELRGMKQRKAPQNENLLCCRVDDTMTRSIGSLLFRTDRMIDIIHDRMQEGTYRHVIGPRRKEGYVESS
jgi:hypothetical protein